MNGRRSCTYVYKYSTQQPNTNGSSKYPLFFAANSTGVNFSNSSLQDAPGTFAIEIQSGANEKETNVVIDNVKVINAKNAGFFVKDKFPKVVVKNSEFRGNGVGSKYAVINVNSSKVSFEILPSNL